MPIARPAGGLSDRAGPDCLCPCFLVTRVGPGLQALLLSPPLPSFLTLPSFLPDIHGDSGSCTGIRECPCGHFSVLFQRPHLSLSSPGPALPLTSGTGTLCSHPLLPDSDLRFPPHRGSSFASSPGRPLSCLPDSALILIPCSSSACLGGGGRSLDPDLISSLDTSLSFPSQ